MANRPPSR
jgi:hypothetical protein